MGKKQSQKKQAGTGKKSGARNLLLAVFALAVIAVGAAIALNTGGEETATGKVTPFDESLRRGETRQTLSPDLFSHPTVKAAYQAAAEIPWVLDSIYCYCYCEESPVFRHKSLLSCYVDQHAAA